jgi:hypothetical protein
MQIVIPKDVSLISSVRSFKSKLEKFSFSDTVFYLIFMHSSISLSKERAKFFAWLKKIERIFFGLEKTY